MEDTKQNFQNTILKDGDTETENLRDSEYGQLPELNSRSKPLPELKKGVNQLAMKTVQVSI